MRSRRRAIPDVRFPPIPDISEIDFAVRLHEKPQAKRLEGALEIAGQFLALLRR